MILIIYVAQLTTVSFTNFSVLCQDISLEISINLHVLYVRCTTAVVHGNYITSLLHSHMLQSHMEISSLQQPCYNLIRSSQDCGILCKVLTTISGGFRGLGGL